VSLDVLLLTVASSSVSLLLLLLLQVFNIYQDINTGSVSHTEQQSRKAAFHGP
jgi:hypothetical protein